ncbi:MAG: YceK/YidQ family lipoprotein [Gemmataceae bacterium]
MGRALVCAALAILPALAGCAASQNWAADSGPTVYGGTKTDLALISGNLGPNADPEKIKKISPSVKAYACCCGLVDLPFTIVADTLMLPVVIPQATARANYPVDEEAGEETEKEEDYEAELRRLQGRQGRGWNR